MSTPFPGVLLGELLEEWHTGRRYDSMYAQ